MVEHLSFSQMKNFDTDAKSSDVDSKKLTDYLEGAPGDSLLYIPSSLEIMQHHAKSKEEATGAKFSELD